MEVNAGAERHTIRIGHPDVQPLIATAEMPVGTGGATQPEPTPTTPKVEARASAAIAAAATRQRSGRLQLVSPIELQVFEGERVLGSSADGPVVAAAGGHELEFVNNALG